jgi:hypothetical protein
MHFPLCNKCLYKLLEGCYERWKQGQSVETMCVKYCNVSAESCTWITHDRDRNTAAAAAANNNNNMLSIFP